MQLIKNIQVEWASNYFQFVKMTEHAQTPKENRRDLQDTPYEAPTTQQYLPKKRSYNDRLKKLKFRKGTSAEPLR